MNPSQNVLKIVHREPRHKQRDGDANCNNNRMVEVCPFN